MSFEFVKSIQQLYSVFPRHLIISGPKAPHLPFRMKHWSRLNHKTLKEELKIYNDIDERVLNNDELLDLFLPIVKSDFSIYENYNFLALKSFLYGILTLSSTEDQTVTPEEILAWEKYTKGKFEYVSFPGKHFFIKDHQKKILKIINKTGDRYTQMSPNF